MGRAIRPSMGSPVHAQEKASLCLRFWVLATILQCIPILPLQARWAIVVHTECNADLSRSPNHSRSDSAPSALRQEPHFPLVTNGQNPRFIRRHHETIQGHIARLTIGNNQFAQFTFNASAHQRVCGQVLDRRLNRIHGVQGRRGVLVAQELERSLNVLQRPRGIDYLRHGLGRSAESLTASRFIQAWTSSAR